MHWLALVLAFLSRVQELLSKSNFKPSSRFVASDFSGASQGLFGHIIQDLHQNFHIWTALGSSSFNLDYEFTDNLHPTQVHAKIIYIYIYMPLIRTSTHPWDCRSHCAPVFALHYAPLLTVLPNAPPWTKKKYDDYHQKCLQSRSVPNKTSSANWDRPWK